MGDIDVGAARAELAARGERDMGTLEGHLKFYEIFSKGMFTFMYRHEKNIHVGESI